MTTLILDDTTAQTPIGKLLESATDHVIQVRSSTGRWLGTIVLPEHASAEHRLRQAAEADIDLIRRRRGVDPADCMTTSEFIEAIDNLGSS